MATRDNTGSVTVENTTEEILASFEKFKEVNTTPVRVEELLPSRVVSTDGKMVVFDKTGHCEKFSLTNKRKNVLKAIKNNPDKGQEEIAEMMNCGGSVVSRTCRNFDFLLKNNALYDAYIKGNFEYVEEQMKDNEENETMDSKDSKHPELEFDDYYKIVKCLVLNDEDELAKKILSISS